MADPIASFSGLASGIQWREMVEQIVQLESARRLTPVTSRIRAQEKRQESWSDYSALLTKLNDATGSLRDGTAFGYLNTTVAKSAATGRALLSAAATADASPGNYEIEVIDLARAAKLSGSAVADTTAALNLSGDFFMNGSKISIVATDSLNSVRDKINAANTGSAATGVTATILSTSSTSHSLILTSAHTGSHGIELVDSTSGVLGSLGILNGTQTANLSPTDPSQTRTQRFTSTTSSIAGMLGISAPPATTSIEIDGKKVTVDLLNDTLLTLMNKIAAEGVPATTESEVVGGETLYRLTVGGTVSADPAASDPSASQRIVELLGFVQSGRANAITTGSDAKLRIDGFTLTRRTNTISDAIEGVTLDLLATDSALRTLAVDGDGLSVLTDPRTIDAGTYAIDLTATSTSRSTTTDSADLTVTDDPGVADGVYNVQLTTTTTRSTTASDPTLSVVNAPGTVSAGTYDVNVTQAASQSSTTGIAAGAFSGDTGDSFTIVDNVTGVTGSYTLTAGQTLESTVLGLNNMFAEEGIQMTASIDGGALKLTHDVYGSDASFTVAGSDNDVRNHYGIGAVAGETIANGLDVQGTIGGLSATGSGQVLTGSSGAVTGLQVQYSGSATGAPVGTVTVTDTNSISGGTIGGEAATWDAATSQLTATGGALAGLAVGYSGAVTSGSVGNVTVSTSGTSSITAVTINGEAAVWDDATNTIRGAAGSAFEGLALEYTGPATTGNIGSITVSGDIAVNLDIDRDLEKSVTAMEEFASAYNDVVAFVDRQRDTKGPLYADGSLRSMMSSLRNVLLSNVSGLDASNGYYRAGLAGVALDRDGLLTVDTDVLESALETNIADVRALFSTNGATSDGQVSYLNSTAATQPGSYAVEITAAATLGAHTGSILGGGTYTASDGISDTLTITDSVSGLTKDYEIADGATLDSIVAGLDSLFGSENLKVEASNEGGALKLSSTFYGSANSITLGGSALAGLGMTAGSYAGTDVAGTIGGFAATGDGRVLSADAGTAAEGLSIVYNGSTARSAGTISFVRGLGGMMESVTDSLTDSIDGTIPAHIEGLEQSVDSLNSRVETIEAQLERHRAALIEQFTRMEVMLSKVQSQGSWLASQISALQPK